MNVTISSKTSRDGTKVWYYLEWGKKAGQRKSTKIFTHAVPTNAAQKNFNREQLAILERARSQLIIEMNSNATGYTPKVKLTANFLDFYEQFIKENKKDGNRHLEGSLKVLKKFINADFLSHRVIDEVFSIRFRDWLMANYNGETPANYFARFKRVMRAATKAGYFRHSPAEEVAAKANRSLPKEILNTDEYLRLLRTHCVNPDVRRAFLFCLYTGLAYCDVAAVKFGHLHDGNTLRYARKKTDVPAPVPLHPIALQLIGDMGHPDKKIFNLPNGDICNKTLKSWMKAAGIDKHITWHSARHSLSVILQSNNVDVATVSGILGQTTSKHVLKTYKRYVVANGVKAINTLPNLN